MEVESTAEVSALFVCCSFSLVRLCVFAWHCTANGGVCPECGQRNHPVSEAVRKDELPYLVVRVLGQDPEEGDGCAPHGLAARGQERAQLGQDVLGDHLSLGVRWFGKMMVKRDEVRGDVPISVGWDNAGYLAVRIKPRLWAPFCQKINAGLKAASDTLLFVSEPW